MDEMLLIKKIVKPEDHSLAEFDKMKITKDYFGDRLTEEEIIEVLGRKWKAVLPKIYFIAKKFEWVMKYEKDYLIPFNIWQTDERFRVLGNQKTISNLIRQACDIKLLSCVHENYVFGNARDRFESEDCKWYVIDNVCYKIIDKLCNNDIKLYNAYKFIYLSSNIREELIDNNLRDSSNCTVFNVRDYKFSSKLKIKTSLNDDEIKQILYENYPQLCDALSDINYVNEKYLCMNPEAQRIFVPHISRDKHKVTKISIRDTSFISNLKTHFNSEEDRATYSRLSREQYLEHFFGGKEGEKYYEYDVKSSIYRITYFINTGIWLEDSIDLYSIIYGDDFPTSELRNRYKKFCMSIYFDTDNLESVRAHMLHNKKDYDVDNVDKDELIELLKLSREKMESAIGNRLDNEVFMHESCIYAKLNRSLWDKGFRTVQIYDGFYTQCNGITKEEYNKMCSDELRKITEEYKQKYL